jgi:hypothetical protein
MSRRISSLSLGAAGSVTNSSYLRWGALGGLVGAVMMGVVMMMATGAMGLGYTAMLCSMANAVLGLPPNGSMGSVAAGLMLHVVDGVAIGVIVLLVTLGVRRGLVMTNAKRGLAVGLLAGFVVWLVFGLPVLTYAMPTPMVDALSMMMPANGMTQAQVMSEAMTQLQGMMGQLAAVFLAGHLVFGAGLGVLVGYGVSRKSQPAAGTVANGAHQLKCDACGAAFETQGELMEHAKKTHPMPGR